MCLVVKHVYRIWFVIYSLLIRYIFTVDSLYVESGRLGDASGLDVLVRVV